MRQFFSRYPNGDNFAAHIVKKFALEPVKAHVRAIDGLLRYVSIKYLFHIVEVKGTLTVHYIRREFFEYPMIADLAPRWRRPSSRRGKRRARRRLQARKINYLIPNNFL